MIEFVLLGLDFIPHNESLFNESATFIQSEGDETYQQCIG